MVERPSAAISRAGDAAVRPLTEADRPLLVSLYELRENLNVAPSEAIEDPGYIAAVRAEPWSSPMVLEREGIPTAAALIGAVDTQHRHGRLVLLAREPRGLRTPLALYLRHCFWSYPFHRLYSVIPSRSPQTAGYAEVLRACGFVQEGTLAGHLRVGGRMADLDLFGLLRAEFDAWCGQYEPGWSL